MDIPEDELTFHQDRHIKYWLRCAKTFLPHQYTSNDASRMTLAFFIVSALDILDVLHTKVTAEERDSWVEWIYHCQVPDGGFRGFTGTAFGENERSRSNCHWDPGNLPATFFAILTLVILGDDLSRVQRKACLDWVAHLQKEDGSFGETVGQNGRIEGGSDARQCCFAAGIRLLLRVKHILDGQPKPLELDVKRLFEYISSCQTFEGGFAEGPFNEAHSGLTYCAIVTLSFLNLIPANLSTTQALPTTHGIALEDCVRTALNRQTTYLEEREEEDEPEEVLDDSNAFQSSVGFLPHLGHLSIDDLATLYPSTQTTAAAVEGLSCAGFNGRANKVADTCYCFWNTGALAVLNRSHLIDQRALRRYLLAKVQHAVGGFGKGVGEPPDVLHSYLGLASLALLEEAGLPSLDPTMCISKRARSKLDRVSWWQT